MSKGRSTLRKSIWVNFLEVLLTFFNCYFYFIFIIFWQDFLFLVMMNQMIYFYVSKLSNIIFSEYFLSIDSGFNFINLTESRLSDCSYLFFIALLFFITWCWFFRCFHVVIGSWNHEIKESKKRVNFKK